MLVSWVVAVWAKAVLVEVPLSWSWATAASPGGCIKTTLTDSSGNKGRTGLIAMYSPPSHAWSLSIWLGPSVSRLASLTRVIDSLTRGVVWSVGGGTTDCDRWYYNMDALMRCLSCIQISAKAMKFGMCTVIYGQRIWFWPTLQHIWYNQAH